MSFAQRLQLALNPALPLPLHIDLGEYSCSWENKKIKINLGQKQEGFRRLSHDELMQLMRRLQANSHIVFVNLWGHGIDDATMQEMSAAIAALSELQVLVLGGACPTPYIPQQDGWPAATAPPPPPLLALHPSHTLQTMALMTKVAQRFLHLWSIFRIWKY